MQILCHNFAKFLPKRGRRDALHYVLKGVCGAIGSQGTVFDGIESDVVGRRRKLESSLSRGIAGRLQLTIDGNVDVLIKTGVGFEARFRFGSALENQEVMLEETDTPFDRGMGVVMLEGMRLALGFFDEFTIGYAGFSPGLGEVVGIELEELPSELGNTADNDMFFVAATFFVGVHGTP